MTLRCDITAIAAEEVADPFNEPEDSTISDANPSKPAESVCPSMVESYGGKQGTGMCKGSSCVLR